MDFFAGLTNFRFYTLTINCLKTTFAFANRLFGETMETV